MELTAGRIVHVKNREGDCRPAIVVRVWKDMGGPGDDGFNGVLFRDGSNDSRVGDPGDHLTAWVTSVKAGDGAHEYHDPQECSQATAEGGR